MRALRASIAFLLTVVLGLAAGTDAARCIVPAAAGEAGLIAQAGSIDRIDGPPLTYIAKSGSAPGAVADWDTSRRAPGSLRADRSPLSTVPVAVHPPARVAANERSALEFRHERALASSGWFSFATTTPPPFRT